MNTCTSAITILDSEIKTERIEGLAMTNNGISIRFSVKNDPTNAAIFTPESQLCPMHQSRMRSNFKLQ